MTDLTRLNDVLARVDRPLLMERSVKLIGDEIRDGRRLVSFPRGALGPGPSRHLRRIARDLGAPVDGFAPLDGLQSRAVAVHLGLEPEAAGLVHKIYLEFPLGAGPAPDVVFWALKWRDTGWTHSLYRAVAPDLGLMPAPLRDLARTMLDEPGARALTVEDPGTPRLSLDINVAQADHRLEHFRDGLVTALGDGIIPYLDRHGAEPFGHLAAGIARDGQSFVTLYHGVHLVEGAL